MWKYINVRRLFIFIEQSIDRGTQWAVFEPNDETTWIAIRFVGDELPAHRVAQRRVHGHACGFSLDPCCHGTAVAPGVSSRNLVKLRSRSARASIAWPPTAVETSARSVFRSRPSTSTIIQPSGGGDRLYWPRVPCLR